MARNTDDPILPTDCANFDAPDTDFDPTCATSYQTGPFTRLLVGNKPLVADPSTTAGLAAATTEITSRLALPADDADALRLLDPLRGNMPATAPTTVAVDGFQIPTPTLRNLPFTVSQLSDKNYEFVRTTNAGRAGHFWALNEKFMYGGQNGIGDGKALLQLSNVVPAEEGGLHSATGNLSYTSLFDPKRTAAPI